MNPGTSYCYTLAGLTVRSEFALPELVPAEPRPAEADVEIRRGAVPEKLDESADVGSAQVTPGELLLTVPDVARFQVTGGRSIVVQAVPGVAGRDLRAYLLGSAFGAVYFQRGLFPLHAGVVAMKGMGVAFTGESGAGKSTLSAWMHAQGYPLLCDDVCVVRFDAKRGPLAYPGFPRLKLWEDTLSAFDIDKHGLQRDFARADKYHLAVSERFSGEPVPLGHVFLLHFAEPGTRPRAEDVPPARGVPLLRDNTYRFQYISDLGLTRSHFLDCVRLARSVKLHNLYRARNHASLGDCQQVIEQLVK